MKRFFYYLTALIIIIAAASAIAGRSPSLKGGQSAQGELPKSAILIALGHDSKNRPLQNFADQVEKRLQRKVVTYRQFSDAHYTSLIGKWWDALPYGRVTGVVEQAIRQAVDRYPNSKVIAFNLDGYDPKELFGPNGEAVVSYTNFEVRLLLHERRLFLATRWYWNNRELSLDEADTFWAPVLASSQPESCFLHYFRLKSRR